ncbi:hypothetical protein KIPB_013282 [Kipferlia bialata]|uniref:Solute-binding protein family 3/N-terminal domain-containing protein n=1 Tax=Kipferlia bialata TaxID=797122 RepID=A0A9K3GPJ4_9EUKA|nr:hypothetical protein KIPB_013282 [Kipferlia bialata]|eukprot:g13282.t1
MELGLLATLCLLLVTPAWAMLGEAQPNPFTESTNPQVLTLSYRPYAFCESPGDLNPAGYVTELWSLLNDLMGTSVDVVCGPATMSFNAAVESVSDNVYPVMTSVSLTYERLQLDVLPSIRASKI